ncbi:MAG: creatininase family protein [Gemmatimonadota bacterium]|nr:creatininase family protein [Gemmatimonadota bacterium]
MRAAFASSAISACVALALCSAPSMAQTRGAHLGELTWPEAEVRIREAPLVVIPFGGGAKEHGPHLPMNADARVLEYLMQMAVDSTDVLVAPPILHGWFPAFRAFPGTEVADPDVFRRYVHEVAKSVAEQGARRIVFLNTGISMATGLPISMVARDLRVQYGIPVLVLSWNDLETDEVDAIAEQTAGGHADELETSIHLFLQPDLVHMDRAVQDYGDLTPRGYPGYEPGLFSRDPDDPEYSETGLFGDPTLATREKGERVLAILTRQWLAALRGFSQAPERERR